MRLGEHDLSTDNESHHVDINIEKTILHPDYDKKDGHSDLSLIVLKNIVTLTNNIKPICVPFYQPFLSKSFTGFTPFVAGWGRYVKILIYFERIFEFSSITFRFVFVVERCFDFI